ncbi:MAG: SOS response-associated peptidase [Anaerolineae bacterium]|nr:SOS response-associated peptidase [Anaerolineae bacterium]
MCGRFTLTLEVPEILRVLDVGEFPDDFRARYNIAPSQSVAVIRDAHSRKVEWMRWGLIPAWASSEEAGNRMINARSETVAEKPSFRFAFLKQRCLILADGFYEWQKRGKGSAIPYYFCMKDGGPFMFAGLWALWKSKDMTPVTSCAIITCPANDLVKPIHDRMPVILDRHTMWQWLLESRREPLQQMLAPYEADLMTAYRVSRLVNAPDNDGPECVVPDANAFIPPTNFSSLTN